MNETEFKLWGEADVRQKSFIVQVLHWFHYRPARLRASWKQEEVLTWELIRAFELLPQRLFLRTILERIGTLSSEACAAVTPLLKSGSISVTPYPSLELPGGKRNCKSDIGFGLEARPSIWIEAKTSSFKAADLQFQLKQQAKAMATLMPDTPKTLITLLPDSRALDAYPNISWDYVLSSLRSCERELSSAIPDKDLSHGYHLLARELAERIESHPNRSKGWV